MCIALFYRSGGRQRHEEPVERLDKPSFAFERLLMEFLSDFE
ncbi:MAG: hypothetical protein AAB091_04385 [Elusimicrobiota bacterium]